MCGTDCKEMNMKRDFLINLLTLGNHIDPCQENESPCLNGGMCLDACVEFADYRCQCMEGFTGKNCSEEVRLIHNNVKII